MEARSQTSLKINSKGVEVLLHVDPNDRYNDFPNVQS